MENIQDIETVGRSLYENKFCHHGKDATVLGVAPITATKNYHVTPLVLSSSCKEDSGEALAKWVRNFIKAYQNHPDGEKTHGPIYTLATDGESSFHKLHFILGLQEMVDKKTELGKKLAELPGLNLETGAHGLLTTCDPKHIIKWFATMM